MRRLFVLAVAVSGVVAPRAPARADWAVTRGPNDRRVADAVYQALLRAPDDRAAVRRVVTQLGRSGAGKLAKRCSDEAKGVARLACGHLAREAGDSDMALAEFHAAAVAAPDDPRPRRAAGELLAALGRFDDALPELEAARDRAPAGARAAALEALVPVYAKAKARQLAERQHAISAISDELTAARPSDAALRGHLIDALSELGLDDKAAVLLERSANEAHDPWTRAPLYFRLAEMQEAAHHDDAAMDTLDRALKTLSPFDTRRRETLEREVDIERRCDGLAGLAARWAALPSSKRDAATEEMLGRVLDELGDGASARPHLERAIKLDPRAAGPRRLLIRLYTRAGEEDAAIAELRRLVTLSGEEPRLALELAERLYARADRVPEALALAERIGRRHRDGTTHAALAALYEKWGQKDKALAEQTLLVRLEPDDPEHLIALGELYDQRGNRALANKTWQRLAPGNNPPAAAALRLADVLAEHDQPGEALALLERANQQRPGDAAIERRTADVLSRLHRESEAEPLYRKLLDAAVARDDASQVRDVGARWLDLAAQQGELPHVLDPLLKSAEPYATGAQVELALLVARGRLRERRGTEAERVLRKVAANATRPADRARALESLADLIGARPGGAAEALSLLVRAAGDDATRASMLFGKASARAEELYRDDEALQFAERAVALQPLDAEAHARLGALLEPRDPTRALAELDRALEIDPGRDRLRLRAAELALRRGDDAGAAARYRALLVRAKDEQSIEEAARRAIVVHELTGRLGELEREVAPRASLADGQPALRRLLVEVDRRYVPLLAARAEAGDAAAAAELRRVAVHALAPLLDGVAEGDRDERRAAVQLLGQLGEHGAVPLLLRLATGEAARRGGEPAPAELRAAAAEAASWLVAPDDLPRVEKLASDPEQRVRLAAVVALRRLAPAPGALERLAALIDDAHEHVAAAACLALADAPAATQLAWTRAAARAVDPLWSSSERACAAAVARHLERDPSARALVQTWFTKLAHDATSLAPTAGHLRALFASGQPESARWALAAALNDPGLRRALIGSEATSKDAARASLPRTGSAVALDEWLARAETATATASAQSVRDAARAVLDAAPAPLLADLASRDALTVRLATPEGASLAEARASLLDELEPSLVHLLDRSATAEAPRRLVLALLAERPAGLDAILRFAQRGAEPADRRLAWEALAGERASVIDGDLVARVAPQLKLSLAAASWRERLAALSCMRRHAALSRALTAARVALKTDPDPFVADAARAR